MGLEEISEPRTLGAFLNKQNADDKKSSLVRFVKTNSEKKVKANYSCMMFVIRTFCSCFSSSKDGALKRQIFYKFYTKNVDKLDILYVQKQLKTVDVLAYVLLDPRQRVMLDYVRKEQLNFDFRTGESLFDNDYTRQLTVDQKVQLLENFSKENMDEKDQRLLKIMEPEISSILLK